MIFLAVWFHFFSLGFPVLRAEHFKFRKQVSIRNRIVISSSTCRYPDILESSVMKLQFQQDVLHINFHNDFRPRIFILRSRTYEGINVLKKSSQCKDNNPLNVLSEVFIPLFEIILFLREKDQLGNSFVVKRTVLNLRGYSSG